MTPLHTLDEFFAAAALELHTPLAIVRQACLRGVRRVPLDDGPGTFGVHTHRSRVGVDRVDMLLLASVKAVVA